VLLVAIDVLMESADGVSNRVVEKFGTPHVKQIQLVFWVSPWYTASGIWVHLTWYHVSQLSQATACWLLLHGLAHIPQGNL